MITVIIGIIIVISQCTSRYLEMTAWKTIMIRREITHEIFYAH